MTFRKFRHRKKSVRSTLFFSYAVLILVVIAFLLTFYYFFTSRVLKQNTIDSLQNQSNALVNAIDMEINKMNTLSMNISFSGALKTLINEHLAFTDGEDDPAKITEKYLNTTHITDLLESLIGPFKPVPQVNYYDFKGEMIGAGVYSRAAKRYYTELDWIRNMDFTGGTKTFSPPHEDELIGETFEIYKNRQYISLYRTIFDAYNNPLGIIEVKQFTDVIFKDVYKLAENIVVVDGDRRQLFPFDTQKVNRWTSFLSEVEENTPVMLANPDNGSREMVIVQNCLQTNWKVIVLKKVKLLLQPVYNFFFIILVSTLFFLGVAVFIATRFARKLILPLNHIHDTIAELDWKMISSDEFADTPSNLNELEEIEIAIRGMREKLQESIKEIVEARTQELQATMFALQAQMDPHFIYNILTTIGVMAEEGMHDEISEVVENLTHLLRYISSRKTRYVMLADEIEYCKRYLACMKIRFREDLEYSIDVPETFKTIRVPKLIIQPIIENTMKYGIDSEPPWNVAITGRAEQKGWEITVKDNGPGFSAPSLRTIEKNRRSIDNTAIDREMQINGMGLLNIYARLRLFYGKDTVFVIDCEKADAGACVTIGGRNEPDKEI